MSYFLQNLITALNHGSQYALIALGYTMVYGVLRLINFAHGDVFMLGAFVGAYVARQFTLGQDLDGQTYPQAMAGIYCAMCFCGCIGFLIERFAYRPLRRSSKLSALITAIGVSLLIEYLAQMAWSSRLIDLLITISVGVWTIYFPHALVMMAVRRWAPRLANRVRIASLTLFSAIVIPLCILHLVRAWPANSLPFFGPTPQQFLKINNSGEPWNLPGLPIGDYLRDHWGVLLITKDVIVISTTLVVLILLRFLVVHTRTGKAMRAVSQNYDASRLMGIDLNRVISFTFVLGSMLAAVGGCLTGLSENQATPLMGLIPGLKAFVAAVIGGIGNIPGAAVGGLILGIIETFVSSLHVNDTAILQPYRDAVAFVILIAVLLVKPEGIFGKAVPEKV